MSSTQIASLSVIGKDKKGIIAKVTTCLFENNVNILNIDQKVREGILTMRLQIDVSIVNFTKLKNDLAKIAQLIEMEIKINLDSFHEKKNFAILVTKESHCLEAILKKYINNQIPAIPKIIIGNHSNLKPVADCFKIPFHLITEKDRLIGEEKICALLKKYDIDFIVLARFMKILSPEFVFRFEGRIINIHPSLLPAFPGARPYQQALETGVTIAGVTAHFVTTDLDRGPVILQDAFKIGKKETLKSIRERGQKLEAEVLTKAVILYAKNKLHLHWGKVYFK